jgi:hypothetical protein
VLIIGLLHPITAFKPMTASKKYALRAVVSWFTLDEELHQLVTRLRLPPWMESEQSRRSLFLLTLGELRSGHSLCMATHRRNPDRRLGRFGQKKIEKYEEQKLVLSQIPTACSFSSRGCEWRGINRVSPVREAYVQECRHMTALLSLLPKDIDLRDRIWKKRSHDLMVSDVA